MTNVRWGIVGVGDVCEVKSGPGFQRATGSELVAVMRRDRVRAEDFARRHGVPRVHGTADELIHDPRVDAVYIATHPNSHCELALKVAAAKKPCLVEKPMALNHTECVRMNEAFAAAGVPLWVAYYRRALPRFTFIRDLLNQGAIGQLTSIRVEHTMKPLSRSAASEWRFDARRSGGGLFVDMGSHAVDLIDFFAGPIASAAGFAVSLSGYSVVEETVVAAFHCARGPLASGLWNFDADEPRDLFVLTGERGHIETALFSDADVLLTRDGRTEAHRPRNPPHVHQPLIQTIVDELRGQGACPSTGESAARTSRAIDRCIEAYYRCDV